MKKLLFLGLFILLGFNQAFADITHTLAHNLTISGTPINGTVIITGQTLTTDSVYESGTSSFGYSVLATQIGGGGNGLKISYQVSYDNVNWFVPTTTNSIGTLTQIGTLDSLVNSNNWIIYQYPVSPWIRFNYVNANAPGATIDTITAETVWQDWI